MTGNPDFDDLTKINTSPEAHFKNREKLGIKENYPFIVFSGPSSHQRVMEVFLAIVKALKGGTVSWQHGAHTDSSDEFKDVPVTLGTLWHPRYVDNTESVMACYNLLDEAKIPYLSDELLRKSMPTPEIYVAADLVVGVTSTETVKSVYLGRPTLNIIYPNGVNFKDILEPRQMSAIPTVESKAAYLAESAYEVESIIHHLFGEKTLIDSKRLAAAQ